MSMEILTYEVVKHVLHWRQLCVSTVNRVADSQGSPQTHSLASLVHPGYCNLSAYWLPVKCSLVSRFHQGTLPHAPII